MKSSSAKTALRISLLVSFISLCLKLSGFWITSSTTALSDAAESVIHLLAVAFVYYGLLLSAKPADKKHLYGHERVEFLSVGIEGAVIIIAGITIIYQSIDNYLHGYDLQQLMNGIYLIGGAGIINLALGSYLMKVGQRENNMIVISNGKHTLTDVWTSAGAVVTLLIIRFTDFVLLDSLVAGALAFYIMFEGFKLLRYSIDGLMDSRNPKADRKIRDILTREHPGSMMSVHNLRHRTTGNTTWIELHAIFKEGVSLEDAHDDATILEKRLINNLSGDVIVTIHLEPEGSHEDVHHPLKDADQKRPLEDFI
ncbi:cation diffusion facilitator family transporter [Aliifodinibius salicampi]|uniref:Cation diffusion facilitator family transporter n=1 Tax=Fodinibius salicampi TaxID=1920655 RepID=A0ABT3Q0N9_9BACT|nr:cation diffusion facilitator family transporter [Fodinibius salicampi]MCW9713692.1 cation diffusion facilitator family transporter [Fodinibius salicampi]